MSAPGGEPAVTIIDFLRLFPQFGKPSWASWLVVLRALFALPMDDAELETLRQLAGRTSAPTAPASELWAICGRRGGKSLIAAVIAVYLTTCRQYQLAAGERGTFMVVAADRKQARVVRRYIGGLLHSVPALAQLVARETKEAIELTNGIAIEIQTASFRTIRGYTVVGAICDEIAFWPTEGAADSSDHEILAALRPAMATVPEALLLCLSSPYARRGELWRAHRDHFGRQDGPVLVIQAPTRTLNPTVPQAVIDRAYAEDEASARAEYGAEFRTDVESFIGTETIDACVVAGRHELPFDPRHERYTAFLDAAGGSGQDSMSLAIAHEEARAGSVVVVLDLVREARPPFSPKAVCADFAADIARYGLASATADRWGGSFTTEGMSAHGITVYPSERTKSQLYGELLPMLNSQQVELLDVPRLATQLAALERRTAWGGRDSIDHPPNGHDDVANAAAGAIVELMRAWSYPAEGSTVDFPQPQTWLDVFGSGKGPRAPVATTPATWRPAARGTTGRTVCDYDPWADDMDRERKRARAAHGRGW